MRKYCLVELLEYAFATQNMIGVRLETVVPRLTVGYAALTTTPRQTPFRCCITHKHEITCRGSGSESLGSHNWILETRDRSDSLAAFDGFDRKGIGLRLQLDTTY